MQSKMNDLEREIQTREVRQRPSTDLKPFAISEAFGTALGPSMGSSALPRLMPEDLTKLETLHLTPVQQEILRKRRKIEAELPLLKLQLTSLQEQIEQVFTISLLTFIFLHIFSAILLIL